MKLYALVHVSDHSLDGITSGAIKVSAYTSRLEAENEMYRQLDETWGQMDQEIYDALYNDDFGYAYIRHESFNRQVYDHEWRITVL